jgi:hypothetical protein
LVREEVHCTTISFDLQYCAAQTSFCGKYSVPNPVEHFFPPSFVGGQVVRSWLELVQQVMHVQLSKEKDFLLGFNLI